MELALQDRWILITGASSGIGKEIARQLDQAGANLILHATAEGNLTTVRQGLTGKQHRFFAADFSHPKDLEKVVMPQIQNIQLDGFINCVGVRSRRPLKLLNPEHLDQVMTINFYAHIEMIRILSKKGRFNKGFSIIGISSIASQSGGAGITAYAASKAAMDSANRCLAKELFKKGIRINSIICGQVNTRAYSELMTSKDEQNDQVLDRQFAGLAEPQDITHIVLFLLSNKSRLITGSSFPADGGYLT